jgi:ubiquinol-cytochrome c reductase cytochrome c1 subunit
MARGGRMAAVVALLLAAGAALSAPASAAGNEKPIEIPRQKWSFSGFLGTYDQAQLQRGFKVYTEVCARCHGLKRLAFRNLVQPGGPQFPEAAVKSLAAEKYKVDAQPDEQGKVKKRPAILSDYLPSPYKNEQEARASQPGGALPPDLSLIARARGTESHAPFYMVPLVMLRDIAGGYQEGGVDYLYAFLTGFQSPPKDFKETIPAGMNYNAAFPGHLTGMPDPFVGADTKFDDGTPPTPQTYARDVAAFLAWVANPELEERKRLGILVMAYLLITSLLLYFAKRRIWSKVH